MKQQIKDLLVFVNFEHVNVLARSKEKIKIK